MPDPHSGSTIEPAPIAKVPSGVAGLDEILHGGLPAGRTTVVAGGPGSGKTVLGVQFAHHGAVAGEPALLVSFEDRAAALRRNARALGLDLAAQERAGRLFVLDSRPDAAAVHAGDFAIDGLLAILAGQAAAIGARRLVIDALDVLLRLFADPARARDQLQRLFAWLDEQGLTSVLTVRASEDPAAGAEEHFMEFAADCLLRLDQRVSGQVSTRRLRVVKLRGSGYGSNEYPCLISSRGLRLLPVSGLALEQGLGPPLATGEPTLDSMLGGGLRRGASLLVSGMSGTGKTALLFTFAQAACDRGERVLYVSFEESPPSLLVGMASLGIELQPLLDAGCLQLECRVPESDGTEGHLVRLLELLDAAPCDHLVVDSISACRRMGSEQAAYELLVRLISLARQRGVTVLLSDQLGEGGSDLGFSASSLLDATVLLRYLDVGAAVERVVLVVKARGMAHSNQHHRFRLSGAGFEVLEPIAAPRRSYSAAGPGDRIPAPAAGEAGDDRS